MKFHRPLDDILGSRSKVAILRLLSSGRSMTGRQIALELGMSVWSCHQVLEELAGYGVVSMQGAGRSWIFHLLQDHYLVRELLLPLFEKESQALDIFLERIPKVMKKNCISIVLFGSVARGDEKPCSDVDLLMVTETPQQLRAVRFALPNLRWDLAKEFRSIISGYTLTRSELHRKWSQGLPLFQDILEKGRTVYGVPLREVLRVAA